MDWRLGTLFIYRDQESYPQCNDIWMVIKVEKTQHNRLNIVYTLKNISNLDREPYQVGSPIFDKCYKPLNSET